MYDDDFYSLAKQINIMLFLAMWVYGLMVGKEIVDIYVVLDNFRAI